MSVDPQDPRPRPQYGEYATPEEQRARIRQPDVTEALEAGEAVAAVAPAPAPAPAEASAPAAVAPATKPRSQANRLATIALLAVGAVNVLFSVFGYLDIAPAIQRSMDVIGMPGEFTNTAAAQTWGAIAAVVLVAGYLITAIAAWRRLSAGKISWWIPLVGAVATFVIVSACLMVPLVGDPAFNAYVTSLT